MNASLQYCPSSNDPEFYFGLSYMEGAPPAHQIDPSTQVSARVLGAVDPVARACPEFLFAVHSSGLQHLGVDWIVWVYNVPPELHESVTAAVHARLTAAERLRVLVAPIVPPEEAQPV